ncbi:hypothetical protein [Halioxenophilus sp. WMMB6]|uniref:hypothetical protein n=1 Tax=Halioxenophilus sp. WMMB6 TaxID=3073815 RepID=UPI00295E467E|nr:hypothetical protein [Halioxenophilus sp. WMMB6]
MLTALKERVVAHRGEFQCRQINNAANTKVVKFSHHCTDPIGLEACPAADYLGAFYQTFGSLTLFHEPESGDAAFYIAEPAQWTTLESYFREWLLGLDAREARELLPEWIDACVVIGEIPYSGNYLLMPVSGASAGAIFEFEHDGFEFIKLANNIESFIASMLQPDAATLVNMAAHMRFVAGDSTTQWWLVKLTDSQGYSVSTD